MIFSIGFIVAIISMAVNYQYNMNDHGYVENIRIYNWLNRMFKLGLVIMGISVIMWMWENMP